MAKKRKKVSTSPRQEIKHVNKTLNTMRGFVEAARAPLARRSISPAKAMRQVTKLATKELRHVDKVYHRQGHNLEDGSSQIPRRDTANQRQLLREDLSAQVRQFHSDARRALVCQSRISRREVLFALQKTGKNGNGNRKAVWTDKSYITCKKRG